ncbi:MAG: hypothetical protein GKS05_05195 [Nitrospirales bacterium]|nr:hypothetical protein [Nitrospirales bacterium]
MNDTPAHVAEQLIAVIPPPLSRDVLHDYDLEPTLEQMQMITKAILTMALFWIQSGLPLIVSQRECEGIMVQVRKQISERWGPVYALSDHAVEAYWPQEEAQWAAFARITQQGGEPIAIFGEAVDRLESSGVFPASDVSKLLAVFIDWAPVEEIGDVLAQLENE